MINSFRNGLKFYFKFRRDESSSILKADKAQNMHVLANWFAEHVELSPHNLGHIYLSIKMHWANFASRKADVH